MDLHEDNEKNLVTATFEFPGVSKDDIQINLHDGRLTVFSEVKQSSEQSEGGYAVRERRFGKYSRTLQLPLGVKVSVWICKTCLFIDEFIGGGSQSWHGQRNIDGYVPQVYS